MKKKGKRAGQGRMRERALDKIRLQFDFRPSVVKELDDLKDRLGCSTRGEVLRQALSHFRFLCDEVSRGGVLFVERQGERSRFQLAITPTDTNLRMI
jgi:hypothetical protein